MTFQEFTPLFEKYRSKGLLLDTNLLLLLLVGSGLPHLLETFKPIRNQGFKREDFDLLAGACAFFKTLVTTPHILTETSNHSGKMAEPYRHQIFHALGRLIQTMEERFCPSRTLALRPGFTRFGLADVAVSEMPPDSYLVMTVDFQLAGFLQSSGADVVNFNHLRQIQWDL
jgi:hypothetical protein